MCISVVMWSATPAMACRALVCITVTAAVSLPGQEDSYKGMVKPQLLQGPWSCGPLLVLLGVLRFWGAARALSSWELGGDASVSAQKSSLFQRKGAFVFWRHLVPGTQSSGQVSAGLRVKAAARSQ